MDYITFYLTAFAKLFALTKAGDIIVAKTDPPLISVVASAVALCKRARLINWIQDLFPELAASLGVKMASGLTGQILCSLRNYSLKSAELNVTIGDLMTKKLREQGVSESQIKTIPNWIDETRVVPVGRNSNPLKTAWGLGEKFVIGYSGNMGRAHEFQTVLEAAAALNSEQEIRFLFIGDGKQRDFIEKEVLSRKLSNVIFQPYQPFESLKFSLSVPDVHLVSLKPQMEGYIVPSKFYGIAAAGRATCYIGDPDGEIPRLLVKHRLGITINQHDTKGLVLAFQRMAGNPAETERMGVRARELIATSYSRRLAINLWVRSLESATDYTKEVTQCAKH